MPIWFALSLLWYVLVCNSYQPFYRRYQLLGNISKRKEMKEIYIFASAFVDIIGAVAVVVCLFNSIRWFSFFLAQLVCLTFYSLNSASLSRCAKSLERIEQNRLYVFFMLPVNSAFTCNYTSSSCDDFDMRITKNLSIYSYYTWK